MNLTDNKLIKMLSNLFKVYKRKRFRQKKV